MTSQVPAFVRTLQRQMADYNERVAERIVNARERQGLSAETLALKAGVSVKQMGRIENGKSAPRLSTVRKIADAMDLAVTDLRPDLEAEEKDLRDRLQRIEESVGELHAKLDLLATVIGSDEEPLQEPESIRGRSRRRTRRPGT